MHIFFAHAGTYDIVVCDPPYYYKPSSHSISAHRKYRLMKNHELEAMPVQVLGKESSILLLWATEFHYEFSLGLCRKWGYEPKVSNSISNKSYFRKSVEYVIVASKGKNGNSIITNPQPNSYQFARRKHSQKPVEFYDVLTKAVGGKTRFLKLKKLNFLV